jgi:outer membrane assembly lipoprotein YfiO
LIVRIFQEDHLDSIQHSTPHYRRSLALAWVAVVLLGVLAGCSAKNPYPVGSYERGVFFYEHGKDLEAVGALETYVRHNPTDSLAAEAQFLKAMTYMEMREYPLAAVEFQILRKDYPISDRVEDALFHEGEAYLEQVGAIQRDITGAYEARLHFLKFSQEYPSSKHMPQVLVYMQEISDLMVWKRLEQVKVYRQLGRHQAVAIVLDHIMKDEPATSYMAEVMWERAQTARKLEDIDDEAEMYENLIASFPETEYGIEASKRLAKIDEAESAAYLEEDL